MGYVKRTLLPEEKLLYFAKPHWVIFTRCLLWVVASIIIFIIGPKLLAEDLPLYNMPVYEALALVMLLIAAYYLLSAYIEYATTEYGITDKRVLMKTGWVRRFSLEIFIRKIESVHVYQPVLGRLLGFGTIIISGTGGSKDVFSYIPNPLEFRESVQGEIEKVGMQRDD